MTFRIGQKVVCVMAGEHAGGCKADRLVRNQIYTIRDIEVSEKGNLHLRLVEVINPKQHAVQGYDEPVYAAIRFRPVVERKTDISIFTAMLDKTPERVS